MQDLHSQFRMEFHFDLPPHPPLRHSVALSPWESVSRNFQSPMAPYKFRSLATPKGGRKALRDLHLCHYDPRHFERRYKPV